MGYGNFYILVNDPSVWNRFNAENDGGFQLADLAAENTTRFYTSEYWDNDEWGIYTEQIAAVLRSDGIVMADEETINSGAFVYRYYLGKSVFVGGRNDGGPYIGFNNPVEWLNKLVQYHPDEKEKEQLFSCGISWYNNRFIEIDKKFRYRDDIYLRETSLVGRPDIIEDTTLGEELFFVLRKDDKADPHCVEVCNKKGALGVLPSDVADILLPLYTYKHLKYSAKVVELIKLSQRNKHAKSPIVVICIDASFSKDPVDYLKSEIQGSGIDEYIKRKDENAGIDNGTSEKQPEASPVIEKTENHSIGVAVSAGSRQYVKVRFEDNKSYTYSCDYVVKEGDTVTVEGAREGQVGTIIEILASAPNPNALRFMKAVPSVLENKTSDVEDDQTAEQKKVDDVKKATEEACKEETERIIREKIEAERRRLEEECKAQEKAEAERIAKEKKAVECKAAEAKREAERKTEEEKRKKKEAQKKYEKEFAAWETACRKAKENRKQFVQDILYKEVRVILQKAEEDKTRAIADANALKNEQMHRKMQAQNTLASLGLFRFSEKKKQKETIEDCERRIEEAQQAIAAAHDTYQNRRDSIDQAFWEEKEKQLRSQAEIKYPFPDKPIPPKGIEEKVSDLSPVDDDYDDDDNDVENTAIQFQKMLYKERILAYLRAVGEGRTATDVCNAIGCSSPQKTFFLLKCLREGGHVESYVEKRVTYFKIDEKAGDYFPVDDDYDDDDDDYDDDMENTAIQIQNMSDKDKILAFLKKVGDWRTATDIANEFGWSQSKASALLKYLREGGHVESYIEKGITHFRISR